MLPIVDEGGGDVGAKGCGCGAREAAEGVEEGGHLGYQNGYMAMGMCEGGGQAAAKPVSNLLCACIF